MKLVVLLFFVCSIANAQQEPEVVRTKTELVQTAVTVLDKKGNFVEGLKREQFELVSTASRVQSRSSSVSPRAVRVNKSWPLSATQTTQPSHRLLHRECLAARSFSSSTICISRPTA